MSQIKFINNIIYSVLNVSAISKHIKKKRVKIVQLTKAKGQHDNKILVVIVDVLRDENLKNS